MPSIVAIDPSLVSTGLAYRDATGKVKAYCIGNPKLRGMERIRFIRDAVANAIERLGPSLIVFEGYALGFRGQSNTIFDLGELGGILKMLILESGIDILSVPPKSLKLFATGKGNAKKEQVAVAIEQLLNVKFSSSDQYDAAGLLAMGEEFLAPPKRRTGRQRSEVEQYRSKALAGCVLRKAF